MLTGAAVWDGFSVTLRVSNLVFFFGVDNGSGVRRAVWHAIAAQLGLARIISSYSRKAVHVKFCQRCSNLATRCGEGGPCPCRQRTVGAPGTGVHAQSYLRWQRNAIAEPGSTMKRPHVGYAINAFLRLSSVVLVQPLVTTTSIFASATPAPYPCLSEPELKRCLAGTHNFAEILFLCVAKSCSPFDSGRGSKSELTECHGIRTKR